MSLDCNGWLCYPVLPFLGFLVQATGAGTERSRKPRARPVSPCGNCAAFSRNRLRGAAGRGERGAARGRDGAPAAGGARVGRRADRTPGAAGLWAAFARRESQPRARLSHSASAQGGHGADRRSKNSPAWASPCGWRRAGPGGGRGAASRRPSAPASARVLQHLRPPTALARKPASDWCFPGDGLRGRGAGAQARALPERWGAGSRRVRACAQVPAPALRCRDPADPLRGLGCWAARGVPS